VVTEENPSCHLPHIHGGGESREDNTNPGDEKTPPLCTSPHDSCTLDITTVTQHVYENSGEVDIWRYILYNILYNIMYCIVIINFFFF
jgi:hypothetical protein